MKVQSPIVMATLIKTHLKSLEEHLIICNNNNDIFLYIFPSYLQHLQTYKLFKISQDCTEDFPAEMFIVCRREYGEMVPLQNDICVQ